MMSLSPDASISEFPAKSEPPIGKAEHPVLMLQSHGPEGASNAAVVVTHKEASKDALANSIRESKGRRSSRQSCGEKPNVPLSMVLQTANEVKEAKEAKEAKEEKSKKLLMSQRTGFPTLVLFTERRNQISRNLISFSRKM